ncbi:hypothetical protein K4K57_010791 [Colletotrichum sp. SAR 10_99]|nr:hypothetical protein K4K57_010791 [Colletotrichum sp. SAR 10_99]
MPLWTGRIEHDGQWRIALDNMMAQCELYENQRRFPEPSGQFDEEQENGVDQQLLVPGETDLCNTIDQHLPGPVEQAQQSGHDIQPPLVPSDVRDLPNEPQQPEQAAKVIVADRFRSTDDDAQAQSEETEIVDEPLKPHQEMFISSQKPNTDGATETTPAPSSSRAKDDDVIFLKALQVEHMPDQGGVEDLFNSADNDTSWRKTCEFFGHDKKHVTTKAKYCRQLPGTKRALRPYQLDDVRRAFEQAVVDGHLGFIAVRRLSFISLDHYMAQPEAHNNDSGKCALRGMPFGIQCACEKGGLAARLLQKFPRGATLVVSPSSVIGQTLKEAKAYFELIVDLEIRKLTESCFSKPEAEVFAEIAQGMGVPHDKIIVEPLSTNTGENVRFTYALLKDKGLKADSFVLVQKPYMERRTHATFRKQWPDAQTEFTVTSPEFGFEDYFDAETPRSLS